MRTEVKEHAGVVIIGAGIVGCALAEELTRRGISDVVVVEQGRLPRAGGSTSHAPGLVFQVNTASRTMTEFSRYTVQRYGELFLDGLPCWHPVGSVEVARTPERWADLHRKLGAARAWGVEAHLATPAEVVQRIPLIDPGAILGGFVVPSDGLAKAVRASEALAHLAIARGAAFQGETTVTGFEIVAGRVRAVLTDRGRIAADAVVVCAGLWGPAVGALAGVTVPLVPMQHQYATTTPLPELAGDRDVEVRHAILRDQDVAMYERQVGDRYGVGSYRHRPLPTSVEDIAANRGRWAEPARAPFTPEDFAPSLEAARRLMPALRGVEVDDPMNGIFSFTPDGFPVLGESDVRGLWIAEAIWVTHAIGAARAVAEWIDEGRPSIDCREADIARFEPHARTRRYIWTRGAQGYAEVYDIIHPAQPMNDSRPLRTSPFYERQQALGAYFAEGAGWERPLWYEANAAELEGREPQIPPRAGWSAQFWSPIAGAEHLVTRERAALFDMSPLTKIEVRGAGALAFLQRLTTAQLDRPVGTIAYTLMLDHDGGIRSDMTVARLAADRFQVGANGPLDLAWMERHRPGDGSVELEDVTALRSCLGLWGPRAREVLGAATGADVSNRMLPFFGAREIEVGDVPATALRLSYVGELGWELYTSAEYGRRLWDLLWAAGEPHGLIAAGRAAFTSLRVEKGYRAWGTDMWTEMTPEEAGLGWTIRLDKGDFVGRDAIGSGRTPAGPWRRFSRRVLRPLTLDDPTAVVLGREPVLQGGTPIGFVTSAAYGYSIGRAVAYAWIDEAYAAEGTPLDIEFFGTGLPARVAPDPVFDPKMVRMKG